MDSSVFCLLNSNDAIASLYKSYFKEDIFVSNTGLIVSQLEVV